MAFSRHASRQQMRPHCCAHAEISQDLLAYDSDDAARRMREGWRPITAAGLRRSRATGFAHPLARRELPRACMIHMAQHSSPASNFATWMECPYALKTDEGTEFQPCLQPCRCAATAQSRNQPPRSCTDAGRPSFEARRTCDRAAPPPVDVFPSAPPRRRSEWADRPTIPATRSAALRWNARRSSRDLTAPKPWCRSEQSPPAAASRRLQAAVLPRHPDCRACAHGAAVKKAPHRRRRQATPSTGRRGRRTLAARKRKRRGGGLRAERRRRSMAASVRNFGATSPDRGGRRRRAIPRGLGAAARSRILRGARTGTRRGTTAAGARRRVRAGRRRRGGAAGVARSRLRGPCGRGARCRRHRRGARGDVPRTVGRRRRARRSRGYNACSAGASCYSVGGSEMEQQVLEEEDGGRSRSSRRSRTASKRRATSTTPPSPASFAPASSSPRCETMYMRPCALSVSDVAINAYNLASYHTQT